MGLLVRGRGVGEREEWRGGVEGEEAGRGRDLGGVDMEAVGADMEVLEAVGGMEGRMAMGVDIGAEVVEVEGEVVGGEECIMDVWAGRECRVGSGEGGRGYRRGLGGGVGMEGGGGGEVGIENPTHQRDRRKGRERISTQKRP